MVGLKRGNTVVALDGNVAIMQVPQMIRPLEGYVSVIFSSITSAMAAGAIVVMVFDEPACISKAKSEEQARRDAARKKGQMEMSEDFLDPIPLNDDYGLDDLRAVADCHQIMSHRPARLRFVDEVVRQVLERCKKKLATWKEQDPTAAQGAVIFDGVDPRGADRPIGCEREPGVVATDPMFEALFSHEEKIGEGDIKLAYVAKRVREIVAGQACEPLKEARLHVTCTIDTDSIAIELMEAAKRHTQPSGGPKMHGLLAMREQRSNKREWQQGDPTAVFCLLDIEMLYECLQKDIWSIAKTPSLLERRCAMVLLCTGWALAGSDFTEVKGLRADVVLDCVPAVVVKQPHTLALMSAAWEGDREAVINMRSALRRLIDKCASWMSETKGCQKKTIENVRGCDNSPLLRGCWVASYWNCREFKENLSDFGFSGA